MKPTLYVFTGTGNSLAVARELALKINGTIVPIRDDVKPSIPDGGCVGIIYPVYGWGPPLIVKRFLSRMEAAQGAYVFSIANCGGAAGGSNSLVKSILSKKGITLSSSFVVKMPGNYIVFSGAEKSEEQIKKFSVMKQKVADVASAINSGENRFENGGVVMRVLGSFIMHRLFSSHVVASDKNFSADEKCDGCGVCAKICPVRNIKLEKKHPTWNHHCEQCLACLQWCPREAIQYGKRSGTKSRYHHPDIRLKDIIVE